MLVAIGRQSQGRWVIDGDTIVVAGQRVRLHGIDAPELDQTFWWQG
jgi:endonuclease YncB( thermonuclease family)